MGYCSYVRGGVMAAVGVWLLLAGGAQAAVIPLSQLSSDATDPALLDAVFDFQVQTGDQLSLEVANDSNFTINQIFFNGSDDVSGVSLSSVSDGSAWAASGGPQGTKAGGFGSFDFAFSSDGNAEGIQSGETLTFLFDILGPCAETMGCTMTDFVGPDTFSTPPPADMLAQAAAKFVQGPGDDSAFGAANGEGFPPVGVPEPGTTTLLLLGSGLLGVLVSSERLRARR